VVTIDDFAKPRDFVIGQVANAVIRADPGLCKLVLAGLETDAINVGETDFHPLLTRQIDSRNTCHTSTS
jgi:hypothetical protein